MRNRTHLKSLDVVEDDRRVSDVYKDSDGIWIEPAVGWTCDPMGAHGGHEMNVKNALRVIRGIVRCRANPCRDCGLVPILRVEDSLGGLRLARAGWED